MEILRSDYELFVRFGQLYLTTVYPGVIKAWHYHQKQIDTFAVLQGMIKLVLYDSRQDSPTHGLINEFFLGEHNYQLVQVPTFVLHGLKCVGSKEAMVLNCPSEPYRHSDPDEFRVDPFSKEIPYDWGIRLH
jgi:dTDP-4-dehydrorhamnose 3,5-epimerase